MVLELVGEGCGTTASCVMLTNKPYSLDHDPNALRLVKLVSETAWLVNALDAARDVMTYLGASQPAPCAPSYGPWYIAAGAVRSLVWNSLHGFPLLPPGELDLVYFDEFSPQIRDADIAARVTDIAPGFCWDVVNQAHAHHLSGLPDAAPFRSLEHAISCWPETATAVGVSLDSRGELQVIAPLGLDDLFNLVVRPSPLLRNPDVFGQRLIQKEFQRRWPLLRVVPG